MRERAHSCARERNGEREVRVQGRGGVEREIEKREIEKREIEKREIE